MVCGGGGLALDTSARHLLVELYGCSPSLLDDCDQVRGIMRRAAQAAGATVVAEVFHPYRPQGVTGVIVIEESHFSVHTWPECGYAAVDFYTCGACLPELAAEVLRRELGAATLTSILIQRGLAKGAGGIRVELPVHVSAEGTLGETGVEA